MKVPPERLFIQPNFFDTTLIYYDENGVRKTMPRKKTTSKTPPGLPSFNFINLDEQQKIECNEWLVNQKPQLGDVVVELAEMGGKLSIKYSRAKGVVYASYTTADDHETNPNECYSVAHSDSEKAVLVIYYVIMFLMEDGRIPASLGLNDW